MRPLRGRAGVCCGWYPGSATPGYGMGMLRIPQECASDGCGGERFTPVRI